MIRRRQYSTDGNRFATYDMVCGPFYFLSITIIDACAQDLFVEYVEL